ncbi:MAG: hypothetical protein ACI9WU_001971 [Myxococcota bacterium]|jgi:uncharacterized protein (TIGR02266 family)
MTDTTFSLQEREAELDHADRALAEQERALDALWDGYEKRLIVLAELQDYLGEREAHMRDRGSRLGLSHEVLDSLLLSVEGFDDVLADQARSRHDAQRAERGSLLDERKRLADLRRATVEQRRELLESAVTVHGELERALLTREKHLAGAFRKLVEHAAHGGPLPKAVGDTERDERNRRRFKRIEVCAHVGVGTPHNFFEGRAANLCVGGVFLATRNLLTLGRPVDLILSLPDAGRIELAGEVAWRRETADEEGPVGFGVRFLGAAPAAEAAIQGFLERRQPNPA